MATTLVSDLIGRTALDRDGRGLGTVQDVVVRRTREGRYEVVGLVVGRHTVAGRFGYGGTLEPPTPWHRVLRWMRRHERYLPWEDIADPDDPVRARVGSADLRAWRGHGHGGL
ncbi:PRC-barrel domain-containing protein [Nocardiopsis aegyptia]|uniref:Sporulation protein YlmC with PRC-barrel domain n=1 Tax=Nocardiopsis aegyptia TaxID=220378 RepID=A0A7Z0JA31_9ACTN|nr:PRC-barrel domain-containing protein [Nocardiopsis aegyptia]NYJ33979.1 sporulation protein YlmC with PRC-barrel domain [Nocardiopsis aegyptia]